MLVWRGSHNSFWFHSYFFIFSFYFWKLNFKLCKHEQKLQQDTDSLCEKWTWSKCSFYFGKSIYFRKLPITSGVNVVKAKKMHNSTDLCILKVIIYRILQLPQFLLLFLLFLFLLLSQSSFSLFIIIILKFLNVKTKHNVKGWGITAQNVWLPTTPSMPQTLEL